MTANTDAFQAALAKIDDPALRALIAGKFANRPSSPPPAPAKKPVAKKPAAKAAPVKGYTLTGIKTFRGMEGQGFNSALVLDGVKIATIDDDANGGPLNIYFLNRDQKAEAAFAAFCHKWYVESGEKAAFDKRMKEYGVQEVSKETDSTVMESWANAEFGRIYGAKRLAKKLVTHTCFRLKGMPKGDYYTINRPFSPEMKAQIVAKHGDKIECFLNEQSV